MPVPLERRIIVLKKWITRVMDKVKRRPKKLETMEPEKITDYVKMEQPRSIIDESEPEIANQIEESSPPEPLKANEENEIDVENEIQFPEHRGTEMQSFTQQLDKLIEKTKERTKVLEIEKETQEIQIEM